MHIDRVSKTYELLMQLQHYRLTNKSNFLELDTVTHCKQVPLCHTLYTVYNVYNVYNH